MKEVDQWDAAKGIVYNRHFVIRPGDQQACEDALKAVSLNGRWCKKLRIESNEC
jgi:hypothetical protein